VVVSVGDLDPRQTIALQRFPGLFPVIALNEVLHEHNRSQLSSACNLHAFRNRLIVGSSISGLAPTKITRPTIGATSAHGV
jgi:hypothetical protein